MRIHRYLMDRLLLGGIGVVVCAWCLGTMAAEPTVDALAKDGKVPNQQTLNGHTFTLPDGFEIELIANSPVVERPITADFDEQGRLYVSDSSGSNDKVDKQLADRPHRILRLEDTNGDGKFDKHTVFADKMMFPEGTMWFDGSLYVAAPPSIWKLTDTNNDGIADERVEWFQGKTLTGCANDLHGPYLGPDGWIYWCKGAFAEQTYARPGRKPLVTKASHIFRCRPDGTGIEHVMTGGMDNPVDVIFTPGGERIFTTTFLQHPAGGKRDGLIHAVYGGVYGKVQAVIENHPRTDREVMPVLTHLGAAAPCGLACYESTTFGDQFRGNIFAALFNMQKITRHILEPNGATFQSTDSDFVVSSNRDFHPTDVFEDADGSLIIVDTGGWYKLCCPTSQLWKPDVLGAIYRVRRKGAEAVEDARGTKFDWANAKPEQLLHLLEDERPAVRKRAIQAVAKLGEEVLPKLARVAWTSGSPQGRSAAIWAATRIDAPGARDIARGAIADREDEVRQCAIHSAGLWRDPKSLPLLVSHLKNPDGPSGSHNARAAAEAIGRIGDHATTLALLDASAHSIDRAFDHSVIYAMMEIGDVESVRLALTSNNSRQARAALIALDQMENGDITPDIVLPFLSASDPSLRDAANWIAGRHPTWGNALAGNLRSRLNDGMSTESDASELVTQLAGFAVTPAVQQLLAERIVDDSAPALSRMIALKAMSQSGLRELPETWLNALVQVLKTESNTLLFHAVAVGRAIPPAKASIPIFNAAQLSVFEKTANSENVRLEAASAVVNGLPTVSGTEFQFLMKYLDSGNSVASRLAATDILAKANLNADQLGTLADTMRTVGPLEADRLLAAFDKTNDPKIGQRLVSAVKESSARSSMRIDSLRQRFSRFGESIAPQAEEIYQLLNADLAKQKAHLEETLAAVKDGGDIRRGQLVFNSTKASCSACHAIGYLGGKIGPDLTRIATVRQERDLLEAILYPSASFVRSFEPVHITTTEGQVFDGLVTKETPEEITLTVSATEVKHIPVKLIDETRPGTVSIMPAGLDKQLTKEQLADLLAFLKACK